MHRRPKPAPKESHPSPVRPKPAKKQVNSSHPVLMHKDSRAANAWEKILLRHYRAVFPGEVRLMVQQDLVAPDNENVLLLEQHKFIFVITSRGSTDEEIEISVINANSGVPLSKPGYRTKLAHFQGTAFIDVPVWRGVTISAGNSLPLDILVKPVGFDRSLEISLALVMIETDGQLIRVTKLEEGLEEW